MENTFVYRSRDKSEYKIQIVYNDGLEEEHLNLSQEYWSWNTVDNKFAYKPSEVANKFDRSSVSFKKEIRAYSQCKIVFGTCVDCGCELIKTTHSQSAFFTEIKYPGFEGRCEKHREEYHEKGQRAYEVRKKIELDETISKAQNALENKAWLYLGIEEFEVLRGIVKAKDKRLIGLTVFNGNLFDKNIWKLVKKSENLSLIWIERRNDGGIINFHFLPELEEMLFAPPSAVATPRNDQTKDNIDGGSLDNFSFLFDPILYKTKSTQPDYIFDFLTPKDIFLGKNTKYSCTLYKQPDGTIRFTLKPFSAIENRLKRIASSFEPRSLRDIIENRGSFPGDQETEA